MSLQRRFRREQERKQKKLIEVLHKRNIEKFKGKTDEEILKIINEELNGEHLNN